jgi:hypothetical protein
MTLDETVLQKLADWQPAAGRQTLNLPTARSGWALALTADRHDELGSLVWELLLSRAAAPSPADNSLAAWADRAAGRVTGLTEPLKVLEVDVVKNEALLRSEEPSHRAEKVLYYEVLLRGTNSASLRRFQAVPGGSGKREQVAFALTNEALAKLVADLTTDQ